MKLWPGVARLGVGLIFALARACFLYKIGISERHRNPQA